MGNICKVYHICRENDIGNFLKGYIGVTKYPSKRLHHHKNRTDNPHLNNAFKKYSDIGMYIIYEGDEKECYDVEYLLRPIKNTGWNINIGGNRPPTTNNTGRKHTMEARRKMAKAKIGNRNVGQGSNHHFYGKTGKDSIRYGTKGEKHPNHKGYWVTPNGKFSSMSLAAVDYGVAAATIYYRCKIARGNLWKEWYFIPKEELCTKS